MDTTLIWLGVGLTLMALELLVPGLVVIFMGMAAVLVAGLQWVGLLSSLPASLAAWMSLSVVLVAALRKVIGRWLPAEVRQNLIDEDVQAVDQLVPVIAACAPDHERGRIRFQGTSWPARTLEGTIASGARARLLYRDNLSWIVEPVCPRVDAELGELES